MIFIYDNKIMQFSIDKFIKIFLGYLIKNYIIYII